MRNDPGLRSRNDKTVQEAPERYIDGSGEAMHEAELEFGLTRLTTTTQTSTVY
jgi:hypothetical protein